MKSLKRKGQSARQEVILCLNEHWIVLLRPLSVLIIGWGIFFFLWFVSGLLQEVSMTVSAILLLFNALMLTIVHHWFFMIIIHWEISTSVVTTKRVIDFQNTPFVKNDVTFINIDEIHEIEKKKHGFIANLFDYGDILINLAAAPKPVEFNFLPHPGKFTNLVESIRDNRLGEEIDLEALRSIYGRKYRFMSKAIK